MKFVASSAAFNAAVRVVAAACPARTTQDVLYSIKVECDQDTVRLISTDNMHTVVRCVDDAEVIEPGVALLPSKTIAKIASHVSGEVAVNADGTGVSFKCGGDRFRMNTEEPATHPGRVPPLVSTDYCHAFSTVSAISAIKRTSFATNQVHHKYALSGIALDFPNDGESYMVASDGRRSSAAKLYGKSFGSHSAEAVNTVVPIHGMKVLLSAMLASTSEEVLFSCGASELVVNADDFIFSSRLVEGRFPSPWRSFVLPVKGEYGRAVCECGDLLNAVRKSEIMSDTESKGVNVAFGEGVIVFEKNIANSGASRVQIDAEECHEPARFKTDASYLRDWLAVIPSEEMLSLHYPVDGGSRFHLSSDDGAVYSQAIMFDTAISAPGV